MNEPQTLPVRATGVTVDQILAEHPELMRKDAAPVSDYEANVFARHPEGFKVHFKVVCSPGKVMNNLNVIINALIQGGYGPDNFGNGSGASQEAQQPTPAGPVCPDCGGATEYKSGTKNGKAWAGHFCLATKDKPTSQRHKPVWG